MTRKSRLEYQITIALALIIFICIGSPVCADDNSTRVVSETTNITILNETVTVNSNQMISVETTIDSTEDVTPEPINQTPTTTETEALPVQTTEVIATPPSGITNQIIIPEETKKTVLDPETTSVTTSAVGSQNIGIQNQSQLMEKPQFSNSITSEEVIAGIISDRENKIFTHFLRVDNNNSTKIQSVLWTQEDEVGETVALKKDTDTITFIGHIIPEGSFIQYGSDGKTRVFSSEGTQILHTNDSEQEKVTTTSGKSIPASHQLFVPSGSTIDCVGKNRYISHNGKLLVTLVEDSSDTSSNTVDFSKSLQDQTGSTDSGIHADSGSDQWVEWASSSSYPGSNLLSFSANWIVPSSPQLPHLEPTHNSPANIVFNGIQHHADGTEIIQPVTAYNFNSFDGHVTDWQNNWYGAVIFFNLNNLPNSPQIITDPLIPVSANQEVVGIIDYNYPDQNSPTTGYWTASFINPGVGGTYAQSYLFLRTWGKNIDIPNTSADLVLTYEAPYCLPSDNDVTGYCANLPPSNNMKTSDIQFKRIKVIEVDANGNDIEVNRQWTTGTNPNSAFHPGLTGIYPDLSQVSNQIITLRTSYSAPVAAFRADTTSGSAPLTVQFHDESTGTITSRAWDFNNDGITDSTLENPSHSFTTGTYSVKLTVNGPDGSDTELKADFVTSGGSPTTEPTATVTTTKEFTLTTNFNPIQGSITPESPLVEQGDSQGFTITAISNYEIETIKIDGVNQTITNTKIMDISVNNVQSNHQISATFKNSPVTETTVVLGTDTIVTFSSPGSTAWIVPAGVSNVQYLVVGGGGEGGDGGTYSGNGFTFPGGGGGAGGVLTGTSSVTQGSAVPVTVGAGGSTIASSTPANGGNSVFGTVTALGGGAGGSFTNLRQAQTGGSGGGGVPVGGTSQYGGTGTSGQGYDGTPGYYELAGRPAGGGGGAGHSGYSCSAGASGKGGDGISSSISGTPKIYGGGGGGGLAGPGANAGVGGPGCGGDGSGEYVAAKPAKCQGTGAGGGGAGAGSVTHGAGGSGVVIIRYVTPVIPIVESQLVSSTIPTTMIAGQAYPVSVTMKNIGTMTWNETSLIRLGGVGDGSGDAAKFGSARIVIPTGTNVIQNQQFTFNFTMTGPQTTGTYQPQYRMVWDEHQWFGNSSTNTVLITPPAAPLVANFTANITSGHAPLAVQFTDTSTGNPTGWLWDFGDGTNATVQNPVHTFSSTRSYNVSLNATNAGGSNVTKKIGYITVTPPITSLIANFTTNKTNGIPPFAVAFTDTSTGPPMSWNWNFGDGQTSTEQNPVHVYNRGSVFSVSLNVTKNGVSNTIIKDGYIDTMNLPPDTAIPGFTSDVMSGDLPLVVNFVGSSTGGNVDNWSWDFGDSQTSTQQNPVHTYSSRGNYSVSLSVTNTSVGKESMTYFNMIEAGYRVIPVNISLNNTMIAVTQGDLIRLQLYECMSCRLRWNVSKTSGLISFNEKPKTIITSLPPKDGDGYIHTWDMLANSTGEQIISADNMGGLPGTIIVYVSVNSQSPVADFTTTKMNGTVPLTIMFNDTSTNSPTSWYWEFGDGNSANARNVTWVYNNPGIYTIKHSATNNWGTGWLNKTNYITADDGYIPPIPPVSISNLHNGTVTNNSISWIWTNPGDSDYADLVVYKNNVLFATYPNTTTSVIWTNLSASSQYTISTHTEDISGYLNSTWINATVTTLSNPVPQPPPVAAFSGTPVSGTSPLTVTFTDSSTGNPTSWSWTFGDNSTVNATQKNPVHRYNSSGVYTVKLTVTNTTTGSNTTMKSNYITVTTPIVPPVASFTGTPLNGSAPLTVRFTDSSTNTPTSWNWNFGDGNTINSTAKNPVHTYLSNGIYTVSLTATNAAGSDTKTKTSYVIVSSLSQYTIINVPYTIVIFNGTGSTIWTPPPGVTQVDYLVVAGGGSGAIGKALSVNGGGGGAGGLLNGTMSVTPGNAYNVVVGAGGKKVTGDSAGGHGFNGANSSFANSTPVDGIQAMGGGGGANYSVNPASAGGSGGGGAYHSGAGGAAATGQGNRGGSGGDGRGGGGGGGAGSVGGTNVGLASGSRGGAGKMVTIINSSELTYYAGGGGGGGTTTGGIGGSGGGGYGCSAGTCSNTNGINGLGGGGGGIAFNGTSASTGGSGTVILRYVTPP